MTLNQSLFFIKLFQPYTKSTSLALCHTPISLTWSNKHYPPTFNIPLMKRFDVNTAHHHQHSQVWPRASKRHTKEQTSTQPPKTPTHKIRLTMAQSEATRMKIPYNIHPNTALTHVQLITQQKRQIKTFSAILRSILSYARLSAEGIYIEMRHKEDLSRNEVIPWKFVCASERSLFMTTH